MCFKDIIPSLPQFQIHFPLPTGPSLCPFFFFFPIHQAQFVLPKYLSVCGLPLECGQLTRGYTLKENCLSFFQKLTIVPQLGVGLCAQLPSPDFVHIVTTIVSSYVQLPSLYREDTISL